MRKNIFKKIALLSGLVMSVLSITGFTSVSSTSDAKPSELNIDNTQFVYDYADVFTQEEESKLQQMCSEVGKELGMDLVIVAARNLGGMHERDYADDFYDYGGYKESGVLYLIDLDHDGVWISTAGLALVYIDNVDVENLLDDVWVGFERYDYYKSADDFVDSVEELVGEKKEDRDFKKLEDLWYNGGYTDYEDFKEVYSKEIYEAYETNILTTFKNPFACIGIAAVIALITVLVMCGSSGTRMTADGRTYMTNGSFGILHRFDRFTHTTTTSHKVSSSSGGGSRGHSSSHRSSSGRSHGGGGRRR